MMRRMRTIPTSKHPTAHRAACCREALGGLRPPQDDIRLDEIGLEQFRMTSTDCRIAHAILRTVGWLACVVYSTDAVVLADGASAGASMAEQGALAVSLAAFQRGSTMWVGIGAITGPWRTCRVLLDALDLGSCPAAVRHRHLYLFARPGRTSAGSNSEACRRSAPDIAMIGWSRREFGRACGIRCIWGICARCWHGASEQG